MPIVFESGGFKFFFFSNEGNPREPLHIHVRKAEKMAKFWLKPHVALSESYGMTGKELRYISKVISENANLIEVTWREYFNE
jgi:hypothetical protein